MRKILLTLLSGVIVFISIFSAFSTFANEGQMQKFPVNDGIDFSYLADGNSYVYLGSWRHPSGSTAMSGAIGAQYYETTPSPILWQIMGEEVIDESGGTDGRISLFSKYVLHSAKVTPVYKDSELATWLKGDFLNDFTDAEKQAIPESDVTTGIWTTTITDNGDGTSSYTYNETKGEYGGVSWPYIIKQKVYVPWAIYVDHSKVNNELVHKEQPLYWSAGQLLGKNLVLKDGQDFSEQASRMRGGIDNRCAVITRSPMNSNLGHILSDFSFDGTIRQIWTGVGGSTDYMIRPVTKVKPESVVYLSEISDSPVNSAQTQSNNDRFLVAGTGGAKHYKMTLLDAENLQMTLQENGVQEVVRGEDLKLHISDVVAAGDEYSIGYKIVQEQSGKRTIAGAGQLPLNGLMENGMEISIPMKNWSDVALGLGEYTLHIWLQKNGEASNTASQPVVMPISVKNSPPLTEYTIGAWKSKNYPLGTGQDDSKQFVEYVTALPREMTANKVVLKHDSSKIISFQISTSRDGQNFTPLTRVYPGGAEKYSGEQIYRFTPVSTGYIKYRAILLGTEETQASVQSIRLSAPETTSVTFVNLPLILNPTDTESVGLQVRLTDSEDQTYMANHEAVTFALKTPVNGVEVTGNVLTVAQTASDGIATVVVTDLSSGKTEEQKVKICAQTAVHNLSFYADEHCETSVTRLIAGQTVYSGARILAEQKDIGKTVSVRMMLYVGDQLRDVACNSIVLTDARKGDMVTVSLSLPQELPENAVLTAMIWDEVLCPLSKKVVLSSDSTVRGISVQGLFMGVNQTRTVRVSAAEPVTYESGDSAIVTVESDTGTVRSIGEGRTVIYAKANGKTVAEIPVRVQAGMYVYLQMGQSNATGTNDATNMPEVDLSISEGAYIFNKDDQFEPAQHRYTRYTQVTNGAGNSSALSITTPRSGISMSYMFGEEFLQDHRLTDFGLVGNTLSGCRLEVFEKNSSDVGANGFVNSVERTKVAVEGKDAILKGIIWHQGESNGPSADYTWHMRNMVYDFRKAFGDMELNFLAGGLATDRSYLPAEEQESAAASARQFNQNLLGMEQDLANFKYVDSEGLKLRRTEEPDTNPDTSIDGFRNDTSHFSAKAQVTFGKRYYKKYLELECSK